MDESGLIEFGKDEEIELSDDDSKYEENQTERANIAFGEYCESGAPRALVAFLNCLEKGDVTAIKYNDTVRDDIFFEMVGNKTVLQYLIENNVTLSFSIKSAIQKNVELLKVYFSYGKYDILSGIRNGGTFILNTTKSKKEVLDILSNREKNILKSRNIKFYIIITPIII